MTYEDVCRLCVCHCQDFNKRLFDENGQENDDYILMVKYFDSSYFNEDLAKQLSVICIQCWQHIYDFNAFQQSVLKAQQKLLQSKQSEPESQHVFDNSINIKTKNPVIIVADTSGEISLFEINAVGEKSQENFMGKDLNNRPHLQQQYNNQIPNVHIEDSEALAEPKLEIMDVLSFSDDSTQNSDDEIFRDSTFNTKSLQLESIACSVVEPPVLQRIESNEIKEKVVLRESRQNIERDISKFLPSVECGICKEKQPTFSHLLQIEDIEAFAEPKLEIMVVLSSSDDSTQNNDDKIFRTKSLQLKSNVCSVVEPPLLQRIESNEIKEKVVLRESRGISKEKQPTLSHLLHIEDSEAFAEPKLEIMDVLSSSDDSTQNNDDEIFRTKSLQLKSNACSVAEPPLLQRIESNEIKEKLAVRASRQDIDNGISKFLQSVECGICKEKQPTFSHLLQHFHFQHPARECFTMCCGSKFKKRSLLLKHVNTQHSVPNAYACKLCNRSYLSRISLKIHMRYHNPDFQVKHNTSSIADTAIAKLKPSLECFVCKEAFTTYSLLRNHFQRSHSLHEFHVLCCKRKLKDRRQLREHLQLHVNPNAFQCKVCNKRRVTRASLLRHMRDTHPTSDAGECPKKKFDELDDVISKWTPNLECVICSSSVSTYTLLRRHFLREHPQEDCHIVCCKRKLRTRAQIIEHHRHHANPNIFNCLLCHIHCSTKQSLRSHMRRHDTLQSKIE